MHQQLLKRRRLYYEIEELEELYKNIKIEINNEVIITLSDSKIKYPSQNATDENSINNVMFVLGKDYPFKPPTIYCLSKKNNIPTLKWYNYDATLNFNNLPRIMKCIKNDLKIKTRLPYCNIVNHNWSPALRIQHILFEMKNTNAIKRHVKYTILIREMKLPEDINIYILAYLE